jgi:hypothetical protein
MPTGRRQKLLRIQNHRRQMLSLYCLFGCVPSLKDFVTLWHHRKDERRRPDVVAFWARAPMGQGRVIVSDQIFNMMVRFVRTQAHANVYLVSHRLSHVVGT